MRALVVHCHPGAASFTAAIRDVVLARLDAAGAHVRVADLYASGFDPVMKDADWCSYVDAVANRSRIAAHVADLEWCDTLIFVYPTWW